MTDAHAKLHRLVLLRAEAAQVLAALAAELDGEARERVELAAQVATWEAERAIEAGLRAAAGN